MKNQKKMKKDIEFQEFGKKLPYKVPEDFFEKVSEKTLQKARKREQSSRRKVISLRTFAVAASLVAVAFLGYLKFSPEKPAPAQTAEVVVPKTEAQPKQNVDTVQKPVEENEPKTASAKTTVEPKSDENLSDVLADMSDDELLQLAAMYKSDTFLNESTN